MNEGSHPLNNRGVTLVTSIILIIFASIAILNISVFVTQRLMEMETRRIYTSCIYLAQAGIQGAVFSYRFRDLSGNGYFPLGQINIDSDHYFVLGASAADLLLVDTSNASLSNNGRNIKNLHIQNATNSRSITIDRLIVTWDNTNNLRRIRIDDSNVWNGNASSPVDADITDFTLDAIPTDYLINTFRFQGDMTGANVNVQFVMTDGTTRQLQIFPAQQNKNFTVTATGKVFGSNIFRSIQADYNTLTGRIFSYREVANEITP